MTIQPNIFLVGMPGAGKSTLGKTLAKRLHLSFIDADHELVTKTGVSIATIFEFEGEAGFRERESLMLEELVTRQQIVLATGGGVVLSPVNRALLQSHGAVIYLRASLNDLRARTMRDTKRPLLQTGDPEQVLLNLLTMREPLYNEVAHVVIDTGSQAANKLTEIIIDELTARGLIAPPGN